MKVAWITDTTSGLPAGNPQEDVFVVPLQVIFGDESFKDGVEITTEQFYERLKNNEPVKTSQPSVGDFVSLYNELKEKEYERAVAVHLSAKLSGTLQASQVAAQLAEFPVEIVDSKVITHPLIDMIQTGKQMLNAGQDITVIAETLRQLANTVQVYVLVPELDRLHRGGRMNVAQFLVGNLLDIKPIIHFVDGAIETFEKIRSVKKAKARIIELVGKSNGSRFCIAHTFAPDEARVWKDEIQHMKPDAEIVIAELGPVVGVHTGPGTVGVVWLSE
jgi:DegV family protein with EDD domain